MREAFAPPQCPLCDYVGGALIVTDLNGTIEAWNQCAEQMYGWVKSEAIGRSILDVVPDAKRQEAAEIISRLAAGESWAGEFTVRRQDGAEFPVLVSGSPIPDDQGQPIGIAGITLDLTRQRQTEEAHTRMAAIVEATSDFVATATPNGRLLHINQAGRRMLGVPATAEISGMTIPETHPAWAAQIVLTEGIPSAIAEGSWSGETALLTTDGREIPVSQVIISHKDASGAVQYLSTIARDISDRKRAEQQQLELETKLHAAIESRDEFLGLLSHELRGAVAVIGSASILLRRRAEDLDTSEKEALLGDIGKASERLQRMIDDLLLLAQMELGGRIEPEPIALDHLIDRVVADFGPHREIIMKLDEELPLAAGNEVYVERILLNLLGNSDKYSPAGLPVEVAARKSDRSSITVSVRDFGLGIDPNELEAIFGRFYRSNRTSSRAGGVGLGLRVCGRLVEAVGGDISASRPEDGGLLVSFTLSAYETPVPSPDLGQRG